MLILSMSVNKVIHHVCALYTENDIKEGRDEAKRYGVYVDDDGPDY